MNMDLVRRLVAIDNERDELKRRGNALKAERADLEERLKDEFMEDGVDNLRCDGRTIYLRRDLWASTGDRDMAEVKAYLTSIGISEYVQEKVNTQTLSAWAREREADETLPADFGEHLNLSEVFSVRTTR